MRKGALLCKLMTFYSQWPVTTDGGGGGGGGGGVGGCDGAGKTSSTGASYNLDYSRARAYCTCSRCGWGLFGHFYSPLSFLSSFSLSLGDGPI